MTNYRKPKVGHLGLFSSVAVVAILAANTAAAQQPTPATPDTLTEIVVTAQKQTSTLQKVPAAVTVVQGDQIVRQGATDLAQLSQAAPTLTIEPIRNETNVFIRGVGQTLTSPGSDPAVMVNVNGAYVPSEMSGVSFFDIARIEVLPGPQGTLYGRNAVGGVINIITTLPGTRLAGEGFVEYGNYNRIHAFGAVDLPLGDTFAVRAAVNVLKHDGFYTNGVDDQDEAGGRLTAVWQPQSGTKVVGTVSYVHDGGLGDVAQNVPPPSGNFWRLSFNPHAAGFKTDARTTQATLAVTQQLSSNIDLTYTGAYNHLQDFQRTSFWAGPPLTPLVVNQGVTDTSHELRLHGDFGRFQTIGGLYYFHTSTPFDGTLAFGAFQIHQGPISTVADGEAIFDQTTFSATDKLRLIGGLRYSISDRSLNGVNKNTGAPATPYSGSAKEYHGDWKAGVEYDLTPRSMLYVDVSSGYSPGGFSIAPVSSSSTQASPFKPVTMVGYTVGAKNRFLENKLTANVEAFYYDYKNYQVSQRNPSTGQNQVYNAAAATSYGAQLELDFKPTPDDKFTLAPAYLVATAQTLITPAGNFDGKQLPYAPQWTLNGSYEHKFEFNDSAFLSTLVNFQYVDSEWAFYTHAAGGHIPGETQVNLDATYHLPGDRLTFSLWGRNVGNALVLTSGISGTNPGPASYFAAPPRTFGIRIGFKT